ncbi:MULTISPECIES: class I SAM-dependent methyltransferase [unclassified Neptuniibacter]|uniref:class I SAM-dependent methyltransferase n=1 Tax=unclassified Neptuniibacter TaxID=2630693 RepID=UPI000C5ED524|nr:MULTISPECIES: class I SAM-dependent methyltransferase [unclassified Neptuniibacter]MAY42840.1 SAM-dependent methyltransferase [Oceanospirillaceae bacterium]|tara:strand:- start:5626 stop:6267 length:642 start_codon:yes stop_codon:yes gene_type:complete
MTYSTVFWNRIAKSYANKPVADVEAYEFKLDKIRGELNPDMNVFEFGCGTGSTALKLAPLVASYQAIDFSEKMIAIAQGKLRDTPIPQLDFLQSALEEHPIQNNSLDAIIAMSVLHLMNEPQSAIAHAFTKLKPGGLFISNTACIADSMPWFKYIAPLGHSLRLLPKLHVFKQTTLMAYLTEAGFTTKYEWITENNKMTLFVISQKPLKSTQS